MNTYSHITIGTLLYERVRREYGICLHKKSFIRGNYSPDFSFGLITCPHHAKNKLEAVEKEITALSGTPFESADTGRDYSKRLGIVCHYLADFFCYAHSERFAGNMAVHILYERRLNRFMKSRLDTLKNLKPRGESCPDPGALCEKLEQYQVYYRKSGAAMETDLFFTLQACMEMILSVVRYSARLDDNEGEVYPVPEACAF